MEGRPRETCVFCPRDLAVHRTRDSPPPRRIYSAPACPLDGLRIRLAGTTSRSRRFVDSKELAWQQPRAECVDYVVDHHSNARSSLVKRRAFVARRFRTQNWCDREREPSRQLGEGDRSSTALHGCLLSEPLL